jgi:predicted protein tyrosine phosphatase
MVSSPIPDSYWVESGRLLAGEYPGARLEHDVLPRLDAFAEAGITSFIDLTEEREGLSAYEPLLEERARFARRPIADGGCPTENELTEILDLIDAELDRGETVYVHCWGGHGRTGLVVGCWLVRHGLSGEQALERLVELRREVPEAAWRGSPETDAQRRLVLGKAG